MIRLWTGLLLSSIVSTWNPGERLCNESFCLRNFPNSGRRKLKLVYEYIKASFLLWELLLFSCIQVKSYGKFNVGSKTVLRLNKMLMCASRNFLILCSCWCWCIYRNRIIAKMLWNYFSVVAFLFRTHFCMQKKAGRKTWA